jgi:hypothetical protein
MRRPLEPTCRLLALLAIVPACAEESWWTVDAGPDDDADVATDDATPPDADDDVRCGDGVCAAPTESAADTRLRVRLPDGSELHETDDDVPCSFPPPQYSCPEHDVTATVTGLYAVEVYVGSTEICADQDLVNYELTVTVADASSELILIGDQ